MSSSNDPTLQGTLRIVAQTELTEIRVSDARFNTIPLSDSNSGEVETQLPEGMYQVAFRDGVCWQKSEPLLLLAGQMIEVSQGAGAGVETKVDANAQLPSARIESLGSTGSVSVESSISHALPSNLTFELPGPEIEGAIVVSVGNNRDLPPGAVSEGLSIVGADEQVVAPLIEMLGQVSKLGFQVPPGYWRLRLDTAVDGLNLEMPIFVAPGWKLRISCPRRAYGAQSGVLRADLANAVVRLSPAFGEESGQDQAAEKMRKAEANALASLATARPLHGSSLRKLLRDLLSQKTFNPMLGLYAAYLLPAKNEDEAELLGEILAHLDQLLYTGPERNLPRLETPHPDLQALGLRLAKLRHAEPTIERIDNPPLMRAGWETVRSASVRYPSLVQHGSLIDSVSGSWWGPSVWTIWKRPNPTLITANSPSARSLSISARSLSLAPSNSVASEPDIAADVLLIDAALHHAALREWFRSSPLDAEQQTVGKAIHPLAEDEKGQRLKETLRLSAPPGQPAWTVERLSRAAQMPATTVSRAVRSLAAKLLEQATLLHLDLKARSTMSRPDVIIPYDPGFLGDGFSVPLPGLRPALLASAFSDGAVLDYAHYSLVMHARRRVAAYTAHNIDASRLVRVPGGLPWKMDERAGEYQLGPEVYADNQLDRGHLVRRSDVLWGSVSEARAANKSTFFYTNAAPQHENFNQDEWLALEDWVLNEAPDFSFRLCVFTGPVLRDDDPTLSNLPPNLRTAFAVRGEAQIPAAFWKVIVLRDVRAGGDDLSAVAFAMKQSEMWNDKEGKRLLQLEVHQVTLAAIEEWTGLDFGPLRDVDELQWSERTVRAADQVSPMWPVLRSAEDITYSGISRRARGIRARRDALRNTTSPSSARRDAHAPCGCGNGEDLNVRDAIATLGRDLAKLTDLVASEQPVGGVSRTRDLTGGAAASTSTSLGEAAEARIESAVSNAPSHLKDRVAAFSRKIAEQAEIFRGNAPTPTPALATRIVGGDMVPPGGFPSCCCIGDSSQWFCTGVVVAPQIVLTAAHCGATISRVMVGGNQVTPTLGSGARVVNVRRVAIHPQYRGFPFNENDINVLILDSPSLVTPAPLASLAQLQAATEVELVGFGYNDPTRPLGFGVKRQVRAPLGPIKLSPNDDLGQLPEEFGFHADYELVAGRKGLGRDSCNGDSGGPAYIPADGLFFLAGLTSRATRTATVNCGDGGIYVRPDRFVEWIREVALGAGVAAPF